MPIDKHQFDALLSRRSARSRVALNNPRSTPLSEEAPAAAGSRRNSTTWSCAS